MAARARAGSDHTPPLHGLVVGVVGKPGRRPAAPTVDRRAGRAADGSNPVPRRTRHARPTGWRRRRRAAEQHQRRRSCGAARALTMPERRCRARSHREELARGDGRTRSKRSLPRITGSTGSDTEGRSWNPCIRESGLSLRGAPRDGGIYARHGDLRAAVQKTPPRMPSVSRSCAEGFVTQPPPTRRVPRVTLRLCGESESP